MLQKQLEELSIYALRELARKTGVVSPTSKKKDELIQEIIDIKSGKKQPQQTKTRQGRPPKGVNYNLDNEDFNDGFRSTFSNILSFKQEAKVYTTTEMPTVSGYVELLDSDALLWVASNSGNVAYFIPKKVIGKYQLKMGDLLMAEAKSNADQKQITDIYTINGCPITKFNNNRKDYFELEHILPNKKIKFSSMQDLDLNFGESVYVYGANNNLNTTSVINILKDMEADERLYINVSIAEKNKIYLKKLDDVEVFASNVTDEIEQAKRVVCLAVERAKRAMEAGKNIVLAIDDVLSIIGIDDEGMSIAKSLMTLTKNADKGSITLLAIMPWRERINIFEKLADKRLIVDQDKIEQA